MNRRTFINSALAAIAAPALPIPAKPLGSIVYGNYIPILKTLPPHPIRVLEKLGTPTFALMKPPELVAQEQLCLTEIADNSNLCDLVENPAFRGFTSTSPSLDYYHSLRSYLNDWADTVEMYPPMVDLSKNWMQLEQYSKLCIYDRNSGFNPRYAVAEVVGQLKRGAGRQACAEQLREIARRVMPEFAPVFLVPADQISPMHKRGFSRATLLEAARSWEPTQTGIQFRDLAVSNPHGRAVWLWGNVVTSTLPDNLPREFSIRPSGTGLIDETPGFVTDYRITGFDLIQAFDAWEPWWLNQKPRSHQIRQDWYATGSISPARTYADATQPEQEPS